MPKEQKGRPPIGLETSIGRVNQMDRFLSLRSTDEDVHAQLRILRLAAGGMVLRSSLSREQLTLAPSLGPALDALDRVMTEMGFGDKPPETEEIVWGN